MRRALARCCALYRTPPRTRDVVVVAQRLRHGLAHEGDGRKMDDEVHRRRARLEHALHSLLAAQVRLHKPQAGRRAGHVCAQRVQRARVAPRKVVLRAMSNGVSAASSARGAGRQAHHYRHCVAVQEQAQRGVRADEARAALQKKACTVNEAGAVRPNRTQGARDALRCAVCDQGVLTHRDKDVHLARLRVATGRRDTQQKCVSAAASRQLRSDAACHTHRHRHRLHACRSAAQEEEQRCEGEGGAEHPLQREGALARAARLSAAAKHACQHCAQLARERGRWLGAGGWPRRLEALCFQDPPHSRQLVLCSVWPQCNAMALNATFRSLKRSLETPEDAPAAKSARCSSPAGGARVPLPQLGAATPPAREAVHVDALIKVRGAARCARRAPVLLALRSLHCLRHFPAIRPGADAPRNAPAVRAAPTQRVYNVVHERSYLDWGLTSDWAVSSEARTRSAAAAATPTRPSEPQRARAKDGNAASEGASLAAANTRTRAPC